MSGLARFSSLWPDFAMISTAAAPFLLYRLWGTCTQYGPGNTADASGRVDGGPGQRVFGPIRPDIHFDPTKLQKS